MDKNSGILLTRTRSNFEAVDLGAALLARFPLQLYAFFALPLCATALLLILTLSAIPWLPPLLLWLFKPLWDRMLILPASVLVFDPRATLPELVRSLGKIKLTRLLFDLTIGRFNVYRSCLLPSILLEGLTGAEQKKRSQVLSSRRDNGGAALTMTFLALESLMLFSWFSLAAAFFPDFVQLDFGAEIYPKAWIWVAFQVLGMLILEPHYALGGFCMYLNGRTRMEGWDIDLVFKRMASNKGILKALLLTLAFSLVPPDSFAQESYLESERQWSITANETLAHPDFGADADVTLWRLKKFARPVQEAPPVEPGINLGTILGGKLLLLIVLGFGVLALALMAASLFKRLSPGRKRDAGAKQARVIFTGAEKPNSDPSLQEAWHAASGELWHHGRHHEALTLLYRESLRFLGMGSQSPIPASATEEECMRLLNTNLRGDLRDDHPADDYFSRLAQARIAESYAGRNTAAKDFFDLRACLLELEIAKEGQ